MLNDKQSKHSFSPTTSGDSRMKKVGGGGTAGPKKNQGGQHKYLSCMVIFHCFED